MLCIKSVAHSIQNPHFHVIKSDIFGTIFNSWTTFRKIICSQKQTQSNCEAVDIVNQFFLGNLEWLAGAIGLYGKTAWEIHECQTRGKWSIIQAEIALLTLIPFPLWSQGSCWVVAPDGLLKASLSAPASLMNTAAPGAFPLVTGVWLFKAGPQPLCLFIVRRLYTPSRPHSVQLSTRSRGGHTRFDHDMFLSFCLAAAFFPYFFSMNKRRRCKLLLRSVRSLFTQSDVKELLFRGSNRAYLNSWFGRTFWEGCFSVSNLFWFYMSGSFIH